MLTVHSTNIAEGDTNKASLSESSSAKQTRRVLASAPLALETTQQEVVSVEG